MATPRKKSDDEIKIMRMHYSAIRIAKKGETLPCPGCGKLLFKNHGQKTFCDNKCGDFYWKQVQHVKDKDPFPPPEYQSAFIGYM